MFEQGQLWVKICGIKDLPTALAAIEAGADALGFVFAPSPREITREEAQNIIQALPKNIERVGVFVNRHPETVMAIGEQCGLTAIQLSGDEGADYCLSNKFKIIKGFHLGREQPLPDLSQYQADAFLFDTFQRGYYGGTGRVFDWGILAGVARDRPIILAGGLNGDNVREGILRVRPNGVDVSGGVETEGKKDIVKIREFIQKAKGVNLT